MGLHIGINYMGFYFVLVFIFIYACCIHAESASSNNPTKSLIVQEIMKKVSNLTIDALSKAPAQTQEEVLNKIEHKLKKTAKIMGPNGKKYISLIMEEFKAKMKEGSNGNEMQNDQDDLQVKKHESVIRRNKNELNTQQLQATTQSDIKKDIIKDISNKIQTLAKGFMKNAKTIESKQEILEKIREKIMNSTKKKHIQIHNKHAELKTYSSLIVQGLKESMRKILESESVGRRMDNQAQADIPNPISEEIIAEEMTENHKPENATEQEILKKNDFIMDLEEIDKYRVFMTESLNGTSVDPRCKEFVDEICLGIQLINQLPCDKGKFIPIESLCNNVSDCSNGTDEKNCAAQAMDQVRKATKVMSEIEATINRKCLPSTENDLLISQNEILRDVLQTQINFLNKHNNTEGTGSKYPIPDDELVKKTVTDINKILSTLSYALDGSLCARITDANHQGNTALRKFNDITLDAIDEIDEVSRKQGWSPKSCRCKGQYCEDPTCRAACKRVCWQRYSLGHWGCEALNGANSVSLNDICDGKLDCFDETDENLCAIGIYNGTSWKFGAAKSYSNLLDLLKTKSKSNDFIKSRNTFIALHGLVRQLQKQTITASTDIHTIKSLRDESFKLLLSIYDDLLNNTDMDKLEDLYLILLAINEKLVTALKGSHTGNENLISEKKCYCRDGHCVLHRCKRHCIQSCLAEPVLTKFPCNDVKNHTTSIESICNGVMNCPNEEDEKSCVKDVCRAHHLVVLRHNLEKVGAKHRGSIIGEIILSWKAKVTAALIVAETTQRTTRRQMVEIVHRVLHDLVLAYATLEDYGRSNSKFALQEFKGISKIVMQTLKTCTY